MLNINLKLRPNTRNASMPTKEVVLVEDVEAPQGLNSLTLSELKSMATEKGISFNSRIKKSELINKLG